ncbi:protein phosphatase 2C domain-containing protein [Aquihabitans sp. McL0605]|uniref:protein phosphatase 2C domain-containing protein n=1 Tax=Aquihabitans sp. McL0605 TaxID=3415671 RepID=UPI003CF38307
MEALTLARDPDEPDANQDSAACDADRGVAVIADGVGGSLAPRDWAAELTGATLEAVVTSLEDALADAWVRSVSEWTRHRPPPKVPLGVDLKASASTLGIFATDAHHWWFAAVGDVNLMHLRSDGSVAMRSSLQSRGQYDSVPGAFTDRSTSAEVRTSQGVCGSGDSFFLFTDGLGQWLVEHTDEATLDRFCRMDEAAYRAFVDSCRADHGLMSDDATLVRIQVLSA